MITLQHYLPVATHVGAIRSDNANSASADDTAAGNAGFARQLDMSLNEDSALGQAEFNSDILMTCGKNIHSQLGKLNGELLDKLDHRERDDAERLVESAANLLNDGENARLCTQPGTDEHAIAEQMLKELQREPRTDFMDRGRTLLDCIGSVLSNDFTVLSSNTARRAGNVIAVATRTGTIVVLTTILRQMVGFALEQNFHSLGKNVSLTPRMVAGIASLLIGPGLNLAGAARDERNGTATATSRISRIWMGLVSIGGLLIASAYDPAAVIGRKLAAIGPQMAVYALTRDVLQTFFPLHENGGTNVPGTLCSGFMYGIAQILLAEGMMNLAPQSGAEYLVSETDRLADTMSDWAAASAAMTLIEPNLLHDLLRSAMNSAVEMFDELQRTALMRYFSAQRESGDPRNEARAAPESVPLASGMTALELTSIQTRRTAMYKISSQNIPNAPPPSPTGFGHRRPPVSEQRNQSREGVRIGLDAPRIGAGYWPTSAQFADNMLTTCAMRTSVFEAVVAIALTVSTALEKTGLDQRDQCHILSTLIGGLVMVGYPAFVGAHVTGHPSSDVLTRNTDNSGNSSPVNAKRQGEADGADNTMP